MCHFNIRTTESDKKDTGHQKKSKALTTENTEKSQRLIPKKLCVLRCPLWLIVFYLFSFNDLIQCSSELTGILFFCPVNIWCFRAKVSKWYFSLYSARCFQV